MSRGTCMCVFCGSYAYCKQSKTGRWEGLGTRPQFCYLRPWMDNVWKGLKVHCSFPMSRGMCVFCNHSSLDFTKLMLADRTTDTCMCGLLPSNWMRTTQCFIGLEFKSNCIYSSEYIHQTCMHARTRTHTHIQTLPCFINPSSPLLEGRSTSSSFGDLESTVNFSVPVETQKMTSLLREGCNGLMLQSCKTAVSLVPRPPFNTEGGSGNEARLLSALSTTHHPVSAATPVSL